MGLLDVTDYRVILTTETDANSPVNAELCDQYRENEGAQLVLGYYTGDSGSATSDPPNDATGVLTDSGAAYDADEHNGRVLIITSGTAIGNKYQIDDTTATTIVCTGDNLYSDGIRSADTYKIFYNINNTKAHTHDEVDSALIVLGDAQVTQAKLKTSQGSVNKSGSGYTNHTLPGGEYGFYPEIKSSGAYWASARIREELTGTSYVNGIALANEGVGTTYAQQRYVTSSGELHWLFMLMESGKAIAKYEAPDHPTFGNRGATHPFQDYDPSKHEIIVVNPSLDMVERINAHMLPAEGGDFLTRAKLAAGEKEDFLRPCRDFLEVFDELYETDELKQTDWPDTPITVALPKTYKGKLVDDWRFMPRGIKIDPVKQIIPQPDFVTPLEIKEKPAATQPITME